MPQTLTDDQIDQMAQASPPSSAAKPLSDDDIDNLEAQGKDSQPGTIQKITTGLAKGFGKVSSALDLTGPLRAGIGEYQRSGSPINAFLQAKLTAESQGEEPPSWKDLAANAGFSTDQSIPTPLIQNPWGKTAQEKYTHLSPAGVAGAVAGVATDPLTYLGGPGEELAAKIPEAADAAVSGLRQVAAERAVKQATGVNRGAIRTAADVPTKGGNILNAESNIGDMGRTLLSKDEAGPAALAPSARQTAINAGAKRDFFGKKIGEVGDQIDKVIPGAVDGQTIADQINEYAKGIPATENGKALKARLSVEAENIQNMGDMSFADAQKLKNQFQYKPQDADALISNQDATNALKKAVSSALDDTAERVGNLPKTVDGLKNDGWQFNVADVPEGPNGRPLKHVAIYDPEGKWAGQVSFEGQEDGTLKPMLEHVNKEHADIPLNEATKYIANGSPDFGGLLGQYKYFKGKYGAYSQAEDAATQNALGQLSNRFVSPSDYGTAAAAGLSTSMMSHNPLLTGAAMVGGAAVNQVGRKVGNYAAAKGADFVAGVIQNSPQTFQKWLPQLSKAMSMGPAILSAQHHLLLENDPEYAKSFEGAQK